MEKAYIEFRKPGGRAGKVHPVQFNPQELSLKINEDSKVKKKKNYQVEDGTVSGRVYSYGGNATQISLRARLIVDSTAAEGAMGRDVQTEAEGFLAAVKSPLRRNVCFCWNRFCMEGMLTAVEAEYTQFDTSGLPVRGNIDITIDGTRFAGGDGS